MPVRLFKFTTIIFLISIVTLTIGPTILMLGTRTTGLQDAINPATLLGTLLLLISLILYLFYVNLVSFRKNHSNINGDAELVQAK